MRPLGYLHPIVLILFLLPLKSDAQEVMSLNPLFTEKDAVVEPAIEGAWYDNSGNNIVISRAGDNFYHMLSTFAGISSRYEAILVRVAGRLILDIFPQVSDGETVFNHDHIARLHTIYDINISMCGDTLRVAPVNYKYFHEAAVRNNQEFEYAWSTGGILLTSSTEDFNELVLSQCNFKAFWGDELIFERRGSNSETSFSIKNVDSTIGIINSVEYLTNYSDSATIPECEPDFPYNNGWLGGDAALSIPISPTQNLWIFSDTWIGLEDQRLRKGARMVANTIAISTCDKEQGWRVEYFWRNMYSENPKPFFESMTHRYKYWPREAFVYQDDLYVALSKVGPKLSATSDDIFSFSHIGSSLAKISNFRTTSPNKWTIELIPWSSFIESDNWSFLAKHENHLYIFNRNLEATTFLIRVPLATLANPKAKMEYLATDMSWQHGFDPAQARAVMKEGKSGGGSLHYHKDLQQWIAVYGPRFLDDKIFMLTAPDITGPWSEEIAVYITPELTPGNAGFDDSYFCYAAREHIQFYDEKAKRLLVTYDCNSSELSTLLSNMEIYRPRVISIPVVDSILPLGD